MCQIYVRYILRFPNNPRGKKGRWSKPVYTRSYSGMIVHHLKRGERANCSKIRRFGKEFANIQLLEHQMERAIRELTSQNQRYPVLRTIQADLAVQLLT